MRGMNGSSYLNCIFSEMRISGRFPPHLFGPEIPTEARRTKALVKTGYLKCVVKSDAFSPQEYLLCAFLGRGPDRRRDPHERLLIQHLNCRDRLRRHRTASGETTRSIRLVGGEFGFMAPQSKPETFTARDVSGSRDARRQS